MQQPTWNEIKANMFYYFPQHDMITNSFYDKWNWMQEKHQKIKLKHLHPKYSVEQDHTCW